MLSSRPNHPLLISANQRSICLLRTLRSTPTYISRSSDFALILLLLKALRLLFSNRIVEVVKRSQGSGLLAENIALEPVWEGFGQLVSSVGAGGNCDCVGE
jgi:hypothetical protein